MKANTPELMKFKRLQRKLGESRRGVIGLLEGLWIEVARNCPEGDVGRFSNEEIAIMVDWDRDPDELINALVECRWVDKCDTHRLVVHDWADHCPTYVKGGLSRAKKTIAIATILDESATSSEVQAIATSSSGSACSSELPSTKLSQAKLSQAKPSESELEAQTPSLKVEDEEEFTPDKAVNPFDGHGVFAAQWRRWKRHRSEKFKPLGAVEEEGQLLSLAQQYCADEAASVVSFTISRGAVNLITNGDHRGQKASSGASDRKHRMEIVSD